MSRLKFFSPVLSDKIESDPVLICEIFENQQSDPVRAGLKGRGPGAIFSGGPYDVIHDVIVCKSYVFAD